MTSLLEKARLGRVNALAGLPGNDGQRKRVSERPNIVAFVSSRARAEAEGVLADRAA